MTSFQKLYQYYVTEKRHQTNDIRFFHFGPLPIRTYGYASVASKRSTVCSLISLYDTFSFARLFVKLPWPGDSEVTFSTTCYYQSNLSKVEAILLSALPKDTTSELTGLSSHYPFNAERQAGKL